MGTSAPSAVVLVVGPGVADPGASWLALFGTVFVASAVVLGLTGVLRSTARTDPLTGLAEAIPEGVSASMGVAAWDHVEPSSALLRRADRAMYRNKRRRRRAVSSWTETR